MSLQSRARVLLVGQAPSRDDDPTKPLTGAIGKRLMGLSGIQSLHSYGRTFERTNLLNSFPRETAVSGSDDAFPMPEGRIATEAMMPRLSGRKVVLLGRAVAGAFNRPVYLEAEGCTPELDCDSRTLGTCDDYPGCQHYSLGRRTIHLAQVPWFTRFMMMVEPEGNVEGWIAPHPSGRNRYWNEQANHITATGFWTRLATAVRAEQQEIRDMRRAVLLQ